VVNLAGGTAIPSPTPPAIYDYGTISLTVTGPPTSYTVGANYGPTSTTTSIASDLASAIGGPGVPITAVANGASLTLDLSQPGSESGYSYALTTSSAYPAYFGSGGSFAASASSGSLTSGSPSTIATTVYHYSITNASGGTGYDSNGDLLAYTDSVMGAWAFSYDQLNRLSGAAAAAPVGGTDSTNYCWNYDSFGNRLTQSGSNEAFQSGTLCQAQTSANYSNTWASYNAQNQLTQTNARGVTVSPTYDASGDVTADGANQYLYDAEGRICASRSGISGIMTQDIYDAAGARVAKGTISTWSCDQTTNGFFQTNQYILGPAGEQLTELATSEVTTTNPIGWLHTNIYAGGSLIATYDDDGTGPHFRLTDWLGTMRAQTNYAGALEQTCQSLPFGETPTPCTRATEQFFTGKERDSETGNDYFGARYYASSLGRWMSPDWSAKEEPVPYAKLGDPQSLNLYSYVLNNPTTRLDSDGHDVLVATQIQIGKVSATGYSSPGQSFDTASMIQSFAPGQSPVPLDQLQQNQANITYGAGSSANGDGGCTLGCRTTYTEVPFGAVINVSFLYGDHDKLLGAAISMEVDKTARFLTSHPPPSVTVTEFLPGMGRPPADRISASIDPRALGGFSDAQLRALAAASSKLPIGAVRSAISTAITAEEKARQKKKDNDAGPGNSGVCKAQYASC
jgi:RHS repeat-associated protein